MGYAYDCLIPAGILYNQPGLTKEEFVEALNRIPVHTHDISSNYWGGLEALAHILHLQPSSGSVEGDVRQYIELDRNKILRYASKYIESVYTGDDRASKLLHLVRVNHREWSREEFTLIRDYFSLEESEIIDKGTLFALQENNCVLEEEREHFRTFLHQSFSGARVEQSIDLSVQAGTGILKKRKIVITPIEIYEEKRKEYHSLEQLFQDYPQLHPDQRFDWTQQRGKLCFTDFNRIPLYWFKIDNNYFFDEEHAKTVLTGKYPGENWVDLILTAGAVKNKFWKVLQYRGLEHSIEFFIEHPEVLREYNKARWDADTSLAAQKRGMTNAEFLRFRLEHGGNIQETDRGRLETAILASVKSLQQWAEEDRQQRREPEFKSNFSAEEIKRFVDEFLEL